VQVVLGAVPVVLGTWFYLLSPNVNMPGGRFPLVSILAMCVLLILLFTTVLFFYYTRVGRRLEEGTSRWTRPRLKGWCAWASLPAASASSSRRS
jgi:branched-subunit amino acid ABC-type transport system permease component